MENIATLFDPIKYSLERLDSKRDNEVLKWLRPLENEQKVTFILHNTTIGQTRICRLRSAGFGAAKFKH